MTWQTDCEFGCPHYYDQGRRDAAENQRNTDLYEAEERRWREGMMRDLDAGLCVKVHPRIPNYVFNGPTKCLYSAGCPRRTLQQATHAPSQSWWKRLFACR